jgi:hypothetical protein
VKRNNNIAPIPGEDRKREQIAARYSVRQSTLYGTGEVVPEGPTVLAVFLSAGETIGVIAYGQTTALAGPVPGAPPIFDRWKSHVTGASPYERQFPLVHRMRLVLARVRWWKLRKRTRAGPAECPIRPLRPADRAQVRWAICRHKTTAVETVALLRMDVRQLLVAQAARKAAIEHATARLCAEVAAEQLAAWGRPGSFQKRTVTGKHELIPFEFFANRHVTILTSGWATCNPDAGEWVQWAGPDWGDVRFRRDEVLNLFPMWSEGEDGADRASNPESPLPMNDEDAGSVDGLERPACIEELFAATRRQMAVRRRRQDRIIDRLRLSRDRICLEDIAEWCAREKGSIVPDERLRSEAYRQLGMSLAAGEFGRGRQSRVLFMHPRSNWAKMTPERFDMIPFGEEGHNSYLRCCWIPAEMAQAWFERRNLSLPGHLFPPRTSGGYVGTQRQRARALEGNAASQQEPTSPIAIGKLTGWYLSRRDQWPVDRKYPSEADDLTDARQQFPNHRVSRELLRSVRKEHAPPAWTSQGRRKRARE